MVDGGDTSTRDATPGHEAVSQKYKLVTRASTDAFWDWDPQTDDITRGEEYLTQFGYAPSDVEPEADWWRERIHPEDRDRVLTALQDAVEQPDVTYDETYRLRTKDGSYGYVRSRGYVVYDEQGEPQRMVGAHIDMTDQKTSEQTLKQQNEQLADFTRIVSHDLRNPLNVATGNLGLAQTECDSKHLADVAQALDRMSRLIDDLLTLARSGDQVHEIEPINLAYLSDTCWRSVATADATLVTATEQVIRADQFRLQQLLENLFRNAVDHGGADVTVTVGDLDDAEGFYVADDGPGIPPEKQNQVLERGYSTAEEGTGFGLAIVREIIEAHDWELRVTSSATDGARIEMRGVTIVT